MSLFNRRQFLSASAGFGLAAATGRFAVASDVAEPSLRALAEKRGLFYGCAMKSGQLKDDLPFVEQVLANCDAIVPEYELKRLIIQPSAGAYDFSGPDRLADFARRNKLMMRGHTLVWHIVNPDWLVAELATRPNEKRHLTDYIAAVTKRYGKQIAQWDVINEAIAPEEGDPLGRRVSSPWFKAFGERYFDIAFHSARENAPDALLFYNDYGVEMSGRWYASRRKSILQLLEGLKKRNVPIDALGIQGHLIGFGNDFDEKIYADFLSEVAGMGLKIAITEFDISDRNGPADPKARDAGSGELAKRFLDVTLDNKAVIGIMSWGLSDRYTWAPDDPNFKRPDGQKLRPLPLDENLARKPMWYAMQKAFAGTV